MNTEPKIDLLNNDIDILHDVSHDSDLKKEIASIALSLSNDDLDSIRQDYQDGVERHSRRRYDDQLHNDDEFDYRKPVQSRREYSTSKKTRINKNDYIKSTIEAGISDYYEEKNDFTHELMDYAGVDYETVNFIIANKDFLEWMDGTEPRFDQNEIEKIDYIENLEDKLSSFNNLNFTERIIALGRHPEFSKNLDYIKGSIERLSKLSKGGTTGVLTLD